VIVQTPPEQPEVMLKTIVSFAVVLFAATIALRSEPAPLSAVVVTV
jgi:hypothetical protein